METVWNIPLYILYITVQEFFQGFSAELTRISKLDLEKQIYLFKQKSCNFHIQISSLSDDVEYKTTQINSYAWNENVGKYLQLI